MQSAPGGAPYGGSKAAINILTNVVHQELADEGIRTVAIAPGLTYTPGMREIVTDEHIERVAANHLSGTVITVRPNANR